MAGFKREFVLLNNRYETSYLLNIVILKPVHIACRKFTNLPCLSFSLQCKLFFPPGKVREGCCQNCGESKSIMSLPEDLLQDLFTHERNCIIFVLCLNEEQFGITFGRKLQQLHFPAIAFRKTSGWGDLLKYLICEKKNRS